MGSYTSSRGVISTLIALKAGIAAGSSDSIRALTGKKMVIIPTKVEQGDLKVTEMRYRLIEAGDTQESETPPFKVASKTNPGKLAGGIVQRTDENGEAVMTFRGKFTPKVAMSAMIFAQEYIRTNGDTSSVLCVVPDLVEEEEEKPLFRLRALKI